MTKTQQQLTDDIKKLSANIEKVVTTVGYAQDQYMQVKVLIMLNDKLDAIQALLSSMIHNKEVVGKEVKK